MGRDENVIIFRDTEKMCNENSRLKESVRKARDGQRRYDVGVDANNFFPVSTRQIVSFFEAYRRGEDC